MRRKGRRLELTRSGQALLADGEARWRAAAASLVAGRGFEAAVAELALTALLAGTKSEPEPLDLLAATLAEDGWQERDSGQWPGGQAIRGALAGLVGAARLFGLLTPGDVWCPLPTGLTELGRATALEALRTRAAGPRSGR